MDTSLIRQLREEVTSIGFRELRTPDDVDRAISGTKGTVLVFINSVCWCSAVMARPGLAHALQHPIRPDHLVSVFAGQDTEATARARQYFGDEPPSSPSFALLHDGKLVHMIHCSQIERYSPADVAESLIRAFERYCSPGAIRKIGSEYIGIAVHQ
jgi:putative YphP/YqiW family bacilliredoxin